MLCENYNIDIGCLCCVHGDYDKTWAKYASNLRHCGNLTKCGKFEVLSHDAVILIIGRGQACTLGHSLHGFV